MTGILITYRGFDTLGEVAVLFMVAASVGLLLKEESAAAESADQDSPRREAGEIVRTGTQVLLPMILTFGAYVIVNGHLSAGGGFQGGAIVASGVMLMLLARPGATLNVALLSVVESFAGVIYVSSAFSVWCWRAAFSMRAFCRAASSARFSARALFR